MTYIAPPDQQAVSFTFTAAEQARLNALPPELRRLVQAAALYDQPIAKDGNDPHAAFADQVYCPARVTVDSGTRTTTLAIDSDLKTYVGNKDVQQKIFALTGILLPLRADYIAVRADLPRGDPEHIQPNSLMCVGAGGYLWLRDKAGGEDRLVLAERDMKAPVLAGYWNHFSGLIDGKIKDTMMAEINEEAALYRPVYTVWANLLALVWGTAALTGARIKRIDLYLFSHAGNSGITNQTKHTLQADRVRKAAGANADVEVKIIHQELAAKTEHNPLLWTVNVVVGGKPRENFHCLVSLDAGSNAVVLEHSLVFSPDDVGAIKVTDGERYGRVMGIMSIAEALRLKLVDCVYGSLTRMQALQRASNG